MNILLVYPQCPDTFWNLKHTLPFLSRKSILPPLGLLTVASMLPKSFSKRVIDMAVTELADDDIRWADMVFISGMYIQLQAAREVIDRCKQLQTTTVGGGPLFTANHEMFDDVDHLILNEAEVTLQPFLDDLQHAAPKHIYTSTEHPCVKNTPAPQWDLIDIKKYASMCVQYSRGCPFGCDFCDVTKLFGNRMRLKNADQLIAEFDSLYKSGWRGQVFVVDDNFIGNKRDLKKNVLPALIEWMQARNYPFQFNTQVSINIADDEELMTLMARAGFVAVFIGIETPDENTLKECKKGQNTNRDLVDSVKKVQSFGLQVQAGFIVGFDSDKSSAFDTMIKFIQDSGILTAMVGLLNAPRGTALYKRMKSENRLLDTLSGDNTDLETNVKTIMDTDTLIAGYKKIINTVYSPKQYYKRTMTFLRNYKPAKEKSPLRFDDFKKFARSTWSMGIRNTGRRYYWKPLLWTLFNRPGMINVAISASIYGFHFKKIFSNY